MLRMYFVVTYIRRLKMKPRYSCICHFCKNFYLACYILNNSRTDLFIEWVRLEHIYSIEYACLNFNDMVLQIFEYQKIELSENCRYLLCYYSVIYEFSIVILTSGKVFCPLIWNIYNRLYKTEWKVNYVVRNKNICN